MTESDAVVVHVQTTLEDGVAFQQSNRKAAALRPNRGVAILAWIFFGLAVTAIPNGLADRTSLEPPITIVISVVIGLLPVVLLLNHAARTNWHKMHDPKGLFLRPHDITVSSRGVSFKSDVADLKYDWQAFLRVEETPTHFFLYTDKLMAYIIPKRGFRNTQEGDRFGAIARAHIKPAQSLA